MELIKAILAFIFIESLGFLFISMFLQKTKDTFLQLGLAYGVGVILITTQMMFYSFLHISWNVYSIVIPWFIIFIFNIKKINFSFLIKIPIFSFLEKLFIVIILLTCLFVFVEVTIHPLTAFDAWSNWFLAGKAFYIAGNIDISYIHYVNNSNPPLLNLLVTFVYLCIGTVNDHIPIYFYSFFYVSLIIIFYSYVRKFLSQKFSLLFTMFLATTENVIRHAGRFDVGHADLPLGYLFFASSMLLLETMKTKSIKNFILCELFCMGGYLTKAEGFPFFLIIQVLLIYNFLTWKKLYSIVYFIPFWLTCISWFLFSHLNNLPQNPFFQLFIRINRIPIVIEYMAKEFFNIGRWNFFWIVFFMSLFTYKTKKRIQILALIFFAQFGVYFIIYLMTPLNVIVHITSSFDRLLLHLTPLGFFITAVLIAPYLKIPIWITIEERRKKRWQRFLQLFWPKTKKKI